jgi:hypothetical protein
VCSLNVPAEEADRLKRRGLYVDMDRTGRIREPSEITEAEVTSQLAWARQAAHSARWLLGPQAQARIAHPPPEKVELARALVSVLTQAGNARTPQAAVEVLLTAVRKLRDDMAVKDACLLRRTDGRRSSHARARRVLGGWFHRSAQKTEFVALGVSEYVPGFLAGLSHVGLSGTELEKTL